MIRTLLSVAMILLFAAHGRAGIIISEVYPPGSNAAYGADWFEITNTGVFAIDITGWKVDDNSNVFASAVAIRGVTSIGAGQSIVVFEGNASGSTDATITTAFNTAWGTSFVFGTTIGAYGGSSVGFSSTVDAVNVFDSAGVLQARVDFGASTTGFTFDNSAGLNNVAISQLSVVGVNGAFTSANGLEVGSPGIFVAAAAVPEPSSVVLAGIFFAGVGYRAVRRRRALTSSVSF